MRDLRGERGFDVVLIAPGTLSDFRTTTQVAHERHARSLDPPLLQPLVDTAYKYGVLPRPLNVSDMIWK